MTLSVDIDLANYPGITVAQSSSLFGSTYKLMIPLSNMLPLVYRILNQMPEQEKDNIHLQDKIELAKEMGLKYVYRRPDLFRAVLYTAGAGFLALGLAESKIINFQKIINSSACKAVLNNKMLTGAGCVALSLGSNLIPEAISTGLTKSAKAAQDLVIGVSSIASSLGRGAINVTKATARACVAYKNAWTTNKIEMLHAHVITSLAGAILYKSQIV